MNPYEVRLNEMVAADKEREAASVYACPNREANAARGIIRPDLGL
jgi:hypothetical protein